MGTGKQTRTWSRNTLRDRSSAPKVLVRNSATVICTQENFLRVSYYGEGIKDGKSNCLRFSSEILERVTGERRILCRKGLHRGYARHRNDEINLNPSKADAVNVPSRYYLTDFDVYEISQNLPTRGSCR